jgi:hypothetical protein
MKTEFWSHSKIKNSVTRTGQQLNPWLVVAIHNDGGGKKMFICTIHDIPGKVRGWYGPAKLDLHTSLPSTNPGLKVKVYSSSHF